MASRDRKKCNFGKIVSSCSNRLCNALWQQKSKEMLSENLYESFLDNVVSKFSDLKDQLSKCRKSNKLELVFHIKLKRLKYPYLIQSTCESFLRKKYQDLQDGNKSSPEPWIRLLLLHCIGLATDMPQETFPSEEEFMEVLSDQSKGRPLMERMAPLMPFALALGELKLFSLDMEDHAEFYNKIRTILAAHTVDNLEHVEAINKHILDLRTHHRSFLKKIRMLHSNLDSLKILKEENLPELTDCLTKSGMELALMLQGRMDAVREELFHVCMDHIPSTFDANALRALIKSIVPPLTPDDMDRAEKEIAALEERSLSSERSPLLAVIIPAIRGKVEINEDQFYEDFPDSPYSGTFFHNLKKHAYKFNEDAEPPASEKECDSESEPEAIKESEPLPHPEPESEPPLEPASRSAPDPTLEYAQELLPQLLPERVPMPEPGTTAMAGTELATDTPRSAESESHAVPSEEASIGATAANDSSRKLGERQKATPLRQPVSLSEAIREIIKEITTGASLTPPQAEGPDVSALIRQLIDARDSCGLYWLAKTLGESAPIPEWLFKLLHLGTRYQSRMVSVSAEISGLCAVAAERMEELEEKQKLLLAAAILRPALMMPEQSMSTIATFLSSNLNDGYGLKGFMDALLRSMRSGEVLDDVASAEMTPQQIRDEQRKRLTEETERLLTLATKGKTSYQPATALKQKLFRKDGEIGKLLYACRNGKQSDLRAAVQPYRDERKIRELIKPNIEAKARESIIKDVRLAVKLVEEWITFYESERKDNRTFAEAQLDRLYSVMDGLRSQLEVDPEGRWFIHTMENLRTNYGGISPATELELWPLRLACSTPDAENVFEEAGLAQALRTRDFENDDAVAASLAMHAAFGRITRTREFLDCFPQYRQYRTQDMSLSILEKYAPMLAAAQPFTIDDIMNAGRGLWQEAFDHELEELKERLSDSYFRGAIEFDQQGRINAEISEIVARYSKTPDKAQGIQEFRNLSSELDGCDTSRLKAVNDRISELEKEASGREATSFLAAIKDEVASNHVFSAAWDKIARLEQFLLQPGETELPKPGAEKTSTLDTARQFYDTEPSYWEDRADKESTILWNKVGTLNPRGRSNEHSFRRVTTELQRWLGFVLSSEAQSEEVFSDGRWKVRRYTMTINSPLPQWGSGARNRHTIAFGWNVTPTNISNLVTSGRIKAGEALTIVCCNPLTHEQRKEMLRLAHKWPVFPLVIDKNLFCFLAAQDEVSRTEKLFEVALAGSPCNPYTPEVAGAVPREMFFGRENDKNSVFAPAGSCIIYGGRQLGKSALLEQIYQEYRSEKSPETTVIKYTLTVQDTSLLEVVIRNCVDAGLVNANTSRNTLNPNIKKWLDEKSGRRVLILLDECDRILDEDSRRKFRDVEVLRNLMQETSRNFKVVFTGLHSVQRFSREPNNPLFHFGPNICIGPLSTDAAYDLMTRPMQFLGLEFDDPQLVQMALNYCNYQPKLIQMFCSELVKGINRLSDREPIYTIDKSTMLKVYDSQDLKKLIRQCFRMTVSLDERYLVIGYTMALFPGEKASIRDLQRDLRNYWPAAFSGAGGDIITLQTLLHEMEGLGLIISLGGSYRLRTPNIAELLGGEENVFLELEPYHNHPYQPVAAPDELRMEEANTLVASQYNLLVDKTSHLYWISGSKALGLEKIPEAIRIITERTSSTYRGKTVHTTLSGISVADAMKSLCRHYEGVREGGLIASISFMESHPMAEFMQEAERWLAHLRTDRKYVKVVCLVDPECLYEFIKNGTADRFSSYLIALHPWTKNSVEHWCKAKTLVDRDADAIMDKTGGWPCLTGPMLEDKNYTGSSLLPRDFIPLVPEISAIVKELRGLGDEVCPESDISKIIDIPKGMTEEEFQYCLDTLKSLYILRELPAGLKLDRIAGKTICEEPA